MPITYGYARCSTEHQKIKFQFQHIVAVCPNARLYLDEYNEAPGKQEQWEQLLRVVQPGDTIIMETITKMADNAEDCITAYKRLLFDDVYLQFLHEPYLDTRNYTEDASDIPLLSELRHKEPLEFKEMLMHIIEKQIIALFQNKKAPVGQKRAQQGETPVKATAGTPTKQRKKYNKSVTKRSIACKQRILELSRDFHGDMLDKDIIQLLGMGRNAYYRYKKELKEQEPTKGRNYP